MPVETEEKPKIALGAVAPLTAIEKLRAKQEAELLEKNPLIFHQCERPHISQIDPKAKERQTYTCQECGAQYRLHWQTAMVQEGPGLALRSAKQASWVRL